MHFPRKMVLYYTIHEARALLRVMHGEKWIEKYGPENWPARSSDTTPPDIFVCRYAEDMALKTPVNNLTQLKRRTTEALRSKALEIKNKCGKFRNRYDAIIRENGSHVEILQYCNKT